ncbi:hypothetical protein [Fuerstiella marisgermanici]|uniref:hypothetical protein n=1 Tax=Fuerstiella marisgermanici TaxID=1891926 RepID=UPI00097C327D|nr:hypothetical protein [Fuerstiella marisgermanici]
MLHLRFYASAEEPSAIPYELAAYDNDKIVAKVSGQFVIEGAPAGPPVDDSPTDSDHLVELTESSPNSWILKKAEIGVPIQSARQYLITALPPEVAGGVLLLRQPGEDSASWLGHGQLRLIKPATVYALIRWKYLGKEVLDEVRRTQLVRDGWTEVKGETACSFPNGEDGRWKTYSRRVPAGPLVLQLRTLSWRNNRDSFVAYVFKSR